MNVFDHLRDTVAALERGQVADHMRCSAHGETFPCAQYQQHCQDKHDGRLITVEPVWRDA